MNKLLTSALTMLGMLLIVNVAHSQTCSIALVGTETEKCTPASFAFTSTVGGGTGTPTYLWTFAGTGGTVTANTANPTPILQTPGTYNVSLTVKWPNGDSCVSTLSQTLTVWDLPKPCFIVPQNNVQCFQGNSFYFQNCSSPGSTGAPIDQSKNLWEFGDGNISSDQNPTHNYPHGGTFTVSLEIVDMNGCIAELELLDTVVVFPKLDPKFTANFTVSCPETKVTFNNNTSPTDANGVNKQLQTYTWDFADGSPTVSGTVGDANWSQIIHIYTKDGIFKPTLTVESINGCKETFTIAGSGVKNINYIPEILANPDSPCFAGNNVSFFHKPRQSSYYWLWNFGDPPSGMKNFDDESWSPAHEFTGTGWYNINIRIWEPNCIVDYTACSKVGIKGPQAVITLSPPQYPPNNCSPYNIIPRERFEEMYKNECYTLIFGESSIDYDELTPINPPNVIGTYDVYCNADTISSITVRDTVCKGFPYDFKDPASGIFFKGTGTPQPLETTIPVLDPNDVVTRNIYEKESRSTSTWNYTDPIPTQTVYMPFDPSACSNFPQTVHDSDRYISTCTAPNLVRFTNNTKKFRFNNAYDNDPPSNPVPYDTCASPETGYVMEDGFSGRWGSDSLQYFWDFAEGTQCTSTVSNPDVRCQFSTEIAPYHLYLEEGCWSASLKAVDTVMQCEHTASVNIVMEPPHAGWDTTDYPGKMTWARQRQIGKNDPGRFGFYLNGTPCLGQNYPQRIEFDETLPSCDRQDFELVLDAEAQKTGEIICDEYDAATGTTKQVTKSIYSWIPKPIIEMLGYQWIYNTPGCKKVGVRISTGECFDEHWYEDYKYFPDLDPFFTLRDTSSPFDELETFCPPQPIYLDINKDDQRFITDYRVFWYNTTSVFTPNAAGEDSVTKVLEVIYTICDSTDFSIDPQSGDTTYNNCLTYPPMECPDTTAPPVTLNDLVTGTRKIVNTTNAYDLSQPIIRTLTEPGRYSVVAQIRNFNGCGRATSQDIYVGHINRFFVSDTILCTDEPVHFRDSLFYWTDYDPVAYPLGYDPIPYWDDPVGTRGGKAPNAPYIEEEMMWDFGDGSPVVTTPDPSHSYSQPGRYLVTLTSIDSSGCEIVTSKYIHVVNVTAKIALNNPGDTLDFCAWSSIQFYDSSIVNVGNNPITNLDSSAEWTWTFGDGKTPRHIKNPVHIFKTNDVYDVYLKVTSAQGCVDSILMTDYIHILGPKPVFEIIGDNEGCEPFTATVKLFNPNALEYEWRKVRVQSGDTSVQNSPQGQDTVILTFNKPGTYLIYVAARDSSVDPLTGKKSECVGVFPDPENPLHPTFEIIVNPRDSVFMTISDTIVCPYVPVTFTDVSPTANPPYTQWIWNFDDGTTGSGKTVQHAFSSPGTYNIMLTPTGANCPDTAYGRVHVNDIAAAFTETQDPVDVTKYFFDNNSSNATSYTWIFRDGSGFNETYPTTDSADPYLLPYTFPQAGTYEVCLIAKSAEGCEDTVCTTINIDVNVNIYNVFTPNGDGVNDEFVVDISGEVYYEMVVTNRWGEKVFESNNKQRVWNGKKNNTGAELPDGTYFFTFTYELAGEARKEVTGTVTLLRSN